jgi:hypothetical protein
VQREGKECDEMVKNLKRRSLECEEEVNGMQGEGKKLYDEI